jgi:RNA recognition motif-containing protein
VCDRAASPIELLAAFFIQPLKEEIMETKIYVGNLSYTTTEEELKQLFSQAGTVTSVAMIKDRDTGQSKGFAFIEMSNQAEAEKAISMFNGKSLGSRELKVNLARPREERGSGGYGRGGGYGGRGGGAGGNRRGGSGGGQRRY